MLNLKFHDYKKIRGYVEGIGGTSFSHVRSINPFNPTEYHYWTGQDLRLYYQKSDENMYALCMNYEYLQNYNNKKFHRD